VELEPALKAALDAAKAAGTTVFYDDTCRTEDVSAYTPLGMAFDQVDADHSRGWNDDSAYLRFADYFHKDADLLAPRLAAIAPPVAAVGARDVLLSERDSGGGRYIFLVNNTLPDLQQGALWRVADTITTRSPVRTSVQLPPADVVYDVFALSRLDPANFKIACDLTSLPARLYALLPAPIDRVALSGPASMVAGHSFQWKVAVLSAAGQPIDAGIPVHLRLVSGDGAVLQERYLSANRPAASGNWTVPVNAAGNLTLEATELISGKTATLTMPVTPGQLVAFAPPTGEAVPAKVSASGQASDFSLAVGQHFGPHFRDLAVSQDGSVALINAMNWDTNCFGIDTATGKLQFAQKLGDWFALAPEQAGDGFAVQGYDLSTAQGYHLYLAGKDGIVTRRFAAYALPKRMTSWSFPHLVDHDDNFAVAPNGDWVANDGDLGLAVWSRDGKLLWSQDWRADRHTAVLLAAGNQRLVVARGARVEEYEAVTGKLNWSLSVSPDGSILGGTVSVDGRTVILRSDNDGGRVFVVRDGQTVARLDSMAEDLSLSPDGQSVALVNGKELRWYDIESGLQWNLEGDDYLHFPRISPDGKRVVVSSEIGTVYVLSSSGGLLLEKDLGSLTAPAWLDQGDLLLATWDGDVVRLASTDYLEKWRVHLTTQPLAPPSAAGMTVPTSRMDNWINAAVKPASLTPNLLTDTKALFSILGGDRPDELENPVSLLTDGSITPPPTPWVSWFDINYVDSGWVGKTSLQFDTFRTQIHLTGITLVEDPNHPESWLRDAVLQYWDPVKEAWIDGPTLLSDSAIHTHYFDKPIEAAKFRLVSSGNGSGWPVGNIRLAEVVFHGSILGSSSPDVIAKHPVAVLFDEQESDVQTMQGFGKNGHINYADAFAGGKSLEIETGKTLAPPSNPGFGTAMPNWDYEIDENPQPGQYRYLKFAWKAPSPTTDAMAISVGGVEVYVGRSLLKDTAGAKASEDISDTPPVAWTEVTVDLWKDLKAPTHIYGMTLASAGGPALFDDIRLSQSP